MQITPNKKIVFSTVSQVFIYGLFLIILFSVILIVTELDDFPNYLTIAIEICVGISVALIVFKISKNSETKIVKKIEEIERIVFELKKSERIDPSLITMDKENFFKETKDKIFSLIWQLEHARDCIESEQQEDSEKHLKIVIDVSNELLNLIENNAIYLTRDENESIKWKLETNVRVSQKIWNVEKYLRDNSLEMMVKYVKDVSKILENKE